MSFHPNRRAVLTDSAGDEISFQVADPEHAHVLEIRNAYRSSPVIYVTQNDLAALVAWLANVLNELADSDV